MTPLTDAQIRASFINTTRREVANATLPDLDTLRWDRLDFLGWRDRKAPLAAYVVAELDGVATGIILRATDRGAARRRAMCAWCEDIVETAGVGLFTARRAGSRGRKGDSIGTLICDDFRCSQNVRRTPTAAEAGSNVAEVRELIIADRVEGLQTRVAAFVAEVARTR